MRFRLNIGYVIGALLWLPYWVCVVCEAQSNVTVTVPAGSTIMLPSGSHTNPIFLMPPPQPASDALVAAAFMNMRGNRMRLDQVAWLGTQAFEVLEVEEVSQPEADKDDRGLPTGTFTPMTNYVATLRPKGTNSPMVRGASKDGSVTLIFSKPVPRGITIDVNIRQTP